LEEIKEDWLLELENRLEREYGYTVTDHRLDFKGSYNTCKESGCKKDKECREVS